MAVINPTGAKYAIRSLSAVGTTNVTISSAVFVSGDFGTTQRMVALYTSANVFKGIAWVRKFVSTTVLELENQFVDPVTGLFATQVVGDQVLVSKNLAECVVTGLAWDATNRVATLTAAMNVGTANVETSACIYDENCTIAMTDAIQTTGGVTVFGKLISYDGLTKESMVWNRDVWLNPLSTFQGAGAGTYNYTMLRPNGAGGHFFMFGGNIGGSYQSSNFMGIVGAGTGGKSFAFFGTRQNYGCTSPSNGTTWGANAARHLLYNCFFEATYGNANLIMWGNGTWIGGNITFPQFSSGPLGAFRANGTSNYEAPSGKRALVQDLGQGALIDGIVTSTYNFTNLITPAVNSVRTGSSGASTIVANFNYQDDYTNLKPSTTIVVRRTVDSVVSTSVVKTSSTSFTAKVLQSSYTSTTTGNLNQTANYTSFDYTVKCYGYNVLSGNYAVTNYSLGTGGTGKNMTLGGLVNQLADSGVTLTETNALALSSKFTINSTTKTITVTANGNYDELYDYTVAWGCSSAANAQVPTLSQYLLTTSGANLTAPTGWSLVVNTGVTFNTGTKFTYVYFPNVTINGTGKITGIYANTTGTSTTWRFQGVEADTSIMVHKEDGTVLYFEGEVTSAGDYDFYIPPMGEEPYYAEAWKYPYKLQQAVFPSNAGGLIFMELAYLEDVGISQTNKATVAAYTAIDNEDKAYDYLAYKGLTQDFLKLGQLATRDGTKLVITAPYSVLLNQSAASVASVSGSLITFKGTSYGGGTKYSTTKLTPPATFTANTNEVITGNIEDGNGDSSLTIVGGDDLGYELWKVTTATATQDYATGTLLNDTIMKGEKYRFIGLTGFDIVGIDTNSNVRRRSSMAYGVYTQSFYVGDQIQLADDAPSLQALTAKIEVLTVNIEGMPADFLAEPVETGATVAESLRLANSVLGGKVSGAGTGTETFRDLADTKDRVISTVTPEGNRTAETYDLG